MLQVTSADIRELKDLIQSLDKKVESLDKKVELGFSDLKGDVKTINSRLTNLEATSAKLPDLAEKVGELKNWKQIAIIFFTALLGGSIGWFVRGGK